MFIEVHLLQNFAFSNLNRDDTGAPKSCTFGGYRRARISSQCLKRAIRTYVREEMLVPFEMLSYRTRWLQRELVDRLIKSGISEEQADLVASKAVDLLGVKPDKSKKGRTGYLLMLGEREIDRLVNLCRENLDTLIAEDVGKKSRKDRGNLANLFIDALDGGDAIDLALFGRMIADLPDKNVDAAVQMAHAFSTHAVANEFDFYSAVDDLQQDEDEEGAGAGMLGVVLYNSSCYYRYANIDVRQLTTNLHDDLDKVTTAVSAFFQGIVHAVPTGKRTNSAPQNLPALIMAVVRDRGLWSLANAFVDPVDTGRGDLVTLSGKRLLHHWNQLVDLYETEGIRYAGLATYLEPESIGVPEAKGVTLERRFKDVLDRVVAEIRSSQN